MLKVLCLDDSLLAQKIIINSLKGFADVESTSEISEALKLIKTRNYDFFLFDYHLQDGDGITLAKRLRKISQFKKTPIFIISAYCTNEMAYNAMQAGINDCFMKPVDPNILKNAINSQLKNFTIKKISLNFITLKTFSWKLNDTFYEYSPYMNKLISGKSKKLVSDNINNFLNNHVDENTIDHIVNDFEILEYVVENPSHKDEKP